MIAFFIWVVRQHRYRSSHHPCQSTASRFDCTEFPNLRTHVGKRCWACSLYWINTLHGAVSRDLPWGRCNGWDGQLLAEVDSQELHLVWKSSEPGQSFHRHIVLDSCCSSTEHTIFTESRTLAGWFFQHSSTAFSFSVAQDRHVSFFSQFCSVTLRAEGDFQDHLQMQD